jgi:hypothetical protein
LTGDELPSSDEAVAFEDEVEAALGGAVLPVAAVAVSAEQVVGLPGEVGRWGWGWRRRGSRDRLRRPGLRRRRCRGSGRRLGLHPVRPPLPWCADCQEEDAASRDEERGGAEEGEECVSLSGARVRFDGEVKAPAIAGRLRHLQPPGADVAGNLVPASASRRS